MAALKCFFRFLVENEYLERDPALVLHTPKKREALPDVLGRRELARLLAVVERDDVWERHFPRQARARPAVARPLRLCRTAQRRAAGTRLGRYARAAGVTERKRVTPHTLRHVFASELL